MTSDEEPPAVLVGHPRPRSRTHAVAVRAGCLLQEKLAGAGPPPAQLIGLTADAVPPLTLIDLAELAPRLLDSGVASDAAAAALATVRHAPLVLMASPTFRGACSGLLKLFLDLLPRHGLAATVAVPLMTAGIPAHRSAVDTSLRPVLLELGAVAPAGISVLESELPRFDEVFEAWWTRHGPGVQRAVSAMAARREQVTAC